jgi:putative FmdB family regulatory protein
MPIYEYRCKDCGHKLEALQKLSDAPLLTCPSCGKDALSKLVSAAGFQLKGSGWYATDFKSSGSKPVEKPSTDSAGESKSADASASASKAEAKSDAKSETKTESAPAASASGPTPAAGSSSGSGSGSA